MSSENSGDKFDWGKALDEIANRSPEASAWFGVTDKSRRTGRSEVFFEKNDRLIGILNYCRMLLGEEMPLNVQELRETPTALVKKNIELMIPTLEASDQASERYHGTPTLPDYESFIDQLRLLVQPDPLEPMAEMLEDMLAGGDLAQLEKMDAEQNKRFAALLERAWDKFEEYQKSGRPKRKPADFDHKYPPKEPKPLEEINDMLVTFRTLLREHTAKLQQCLDIAKREYREKDPTLRPWNMG